MTLELNPEQERRLAELLASGTYGSAQEIVDRAFEILLAEAEWFASNRDGIIAAIDEGLAEAERGELIDGDEVRASMAAGKKAWLADKRTA
ncbi:MAG: type II toxin-antitoxin system ParD family antitoxin [Candidatus Solibacter sp.]